MDGLQRARGGRGKPVSRDRWPLSGAQRDWLAHCDTVHRGNGFPSLRTLGREMHLAATRVGELLRGEGLPVDEEQARILLAALGATEKEIQRGARLYRAARAGRDQAARDAGRPGWWLRSGYIATAGDIAPLQLLGRQEELDELATWCASGDEAYAWWQAGPHAGKSALMSWLVLHPPPGTWVISFFVTARLASQADSAAFTDGLLDQLAAVTGQQVPQVTSATLQDGLRRQLLAEAAARAVKVDHQLVLVFDGLDEDCGSLPGSGLPSVAACLPRQPPEGLRVIVASRPDPPLPADVDLDHPLRRCPVRRLNVSPHATEATQLAQRELDEVLAADKHRHDGLGYQVLGLVTASGGGLSDRDLQQLTGRPAFEVDLLLRSVFGRTIASRADPRTAIRVLLFTHETLSEQAAVRLGPDTLADFAARLHAWAHYYQHRGWPADTPAYLMRGYSRMLASIGDLGRLVALATDPGRHHRMLEATGADTAALAEIAAAYTLLRTRPSPDLLAALRLAWHRDQLADRNAYMPSSLPAAWAALGQAIRADALARSITDPRRKASALADLARASAAAGDHDRTRELAASAEQAARSIPWEDQRDYALADVAGAVATVGDYDRSEQVARSITTPKWQMQALVEIARAAAAADDHERAEQVARSITDPHMQVSALTAVAKAVAASGDPDRARELALDAEQVARSIPMPSAWAGVIVAGVDDHERAGHVPVPGWQTWALADVASAVAAAGDYDRAEEIARSLFWPPGFQAGVLADIARTVAASGDRARARELALDAEQTARSITDPYHQVSVLADVARAVATAGDYERAEQVARSITEPADQARALAHLARAMAASGDHDHARELAASAEQAARSITGLGWQAEVLADLAGIVAAAGDYDHARELAASAEQTARSDTNPYQQADAMADLARAVATAGDYERAEQVARSITEPADQVRALTGVAMAVAASGDRARARELALDAEQASQSINDSDRQAQVLIGVAAALAAGGDHDRAVLLARSVQRAKWQARALASVAGAVAAAGDHDRARELTASAEQAAQPIGDWDDHDDAMADLASAAATVGDYDRAKQIAQSIFHAGEETLALADLVSMAATAGDHDRARELATAAEEAARSIPEPTMRAQFLADLTGTVAAVGDHDRARELAASAEQAARSITEPESLLWILPNLAGALAAAGDHDRAEKMARSITDSDQQARALANLATTADQETARSDIAGALAAGRWEIPLSTLARIDRLALFAFADERMTSTTHQSRPDNGLLSGTSGHDIRRGPGNGRPAVRDSDTLSGTSVEEEQRRQRKASKQYAIHGPRRRSNWGPAHDNPDGTSALLAKDHVPRSRSVTW